ncbi:MAG: hypothetical protein LAP85_22725 [Acidobacteriia bacterium]|nr:hypothetical protein [Terriglobia bacterium]
MISKKRAFGFVAGAAVAAAATLLLVPQSGRRFRRTLWRKAKTLSRIVGK